jgi:hypothetical protein
MDSHVEGSHNYISFITRGTLKRLPGPVRTRDLLVFFRLFSINLPLSHSGSPRGTLRVCRAASIFFFLGGGQEIFLHTLCEFFYSNNMLDKLSVGQIVCWTNCLLDKLSVGQIVSWTNVSQTIIS